MDVQPQRSYVLVVALVSCSPGEMPPGPGTTATGTLGSDTVVATTQGTGASSGGSVGEVSTEASGSTVEPTTDGDSCGDGQCDLAGGESSMVCPGDCFCGDNACETPIESPSLCPLDCGPSLMSSDWLSQDYVSNDPAADPYCFANGARKEQGLWTPVRYMRQDVAAQQLFTSFRVRGFHNQSHWTDRIASTFDAPPYFEMQKREMQPLGRSWGGDVFEVELPYVSIVGTSDASSVTGWYNNGGQQGCQYADAWVSYDPTQVPKSPGLGVVQWSDELSTTIAGVQNPGAENCPDAMGTARTRWTHYPKFEFAAASACSDENHKRIDTIVSDHAAADFSHHEVFYFTDVYGVTRWERWECGAERAQEPPVPDYAAMRCAYEQAPSVMHMAYADPQDPAAKWQIQHDSGLYCTLTDCRDATLVSPVAGPGWLPATWQPGADVYYAGNLLQNADFAWSKLGGGLPLSWTEEVGMQSEVVETDQGNRAMVLETEGDNGWFSQRTSLAGFLETLGEGLPNAGEMTVHFGGRVQLTGPGSRTVQVALSQWDADNVQLSLTLELYEVTQTPVHLVATTPFDPDAREIQIRFRLTPQEAPSLMLDDGFVLIDDRP